jgi:hypothetical protein
MSDGWSFECDVEDAVGVIASCLMMIADVISDAGNVMMTLEELGRDDEVTSATVEARDAHLDGAGDDTAGVTIVVDGNSEDGSNGDNDDDDSDGNL